MLSEDGRFLALSNGGLVIKSARLSDAATYRCVSRNVHGEDSASFVLEVADRKVEKSFVEIVPEIKVANIGSTAELTCSGLGFEEDVFWLKDGQRLDAFDGSRTLTIRSVERLNAGVYQCFVRDDRGQEFAASAELRLGGKCCTEYLCTSTYAFSRKW